MLQWSLCYYNDAYIIVKGLIKVLNTTVALVAPNDTSKKVIFKYCASFADSISEINNK